MERILILEKRMRDETNNVGMMCGKVVGICLPAFNKVWEVVTPISPP